MFVTDKGRTINDVHDLAESIGLVSASFELDGLWHRVPVEGKKKTNLSGAYCLSEFSLRSGLTVIVGMLYNWANGDEERLTLDGIEGVTDDEKAEAKQRAREAAEASKKQKAQLQAEIADKATAIWNKLPDGGKSQYLFSKKVMAYGIRFANGSICVPARDVDGKLHTLQWIDGEGNKRFLTGGAKRGNFHLISCPEGTHQMIGITEGYATGCSIFEGTNRAFSLAIAFDAYNILPVGEALRSRYPDSRLVFFADHDIHKGYPQAFIKQSELSPAVRIQIERLARVRPDVAVEVVADDDPRLRDKNKHSNTGVAKALLAASAVDGDVVIPRFSINQEANA